MSPVTSLGLWEGVVQEDRRWAVTDGPVQEAQLPPVTGETVVPPPRGGPDSCAVAGNP